MPTWAELHACVVTKNGRAAEERDDSSKPLHNPLDSKPTGPHRGWPLYFMPSSHPRIEQCVRARAPGTRQIFVVVVRGAVVSESSVNLVTGSLVNWLICRVALLVSNPEHTACREAHNGAGFGRTDRITRHPT